MSCLCSLGLRLAVIVQAGGCNQSLSTSESKTQGIILTVSCPYSLHWPTSQLQAAPCTDSCGPVNDPYWEKLPGNEVGTLERGCVIPFCTKTALPLRTTPQPFSSSLLETAGGLLERPSQLHFWPRSSLMSWPTDK